MCNKWLISVSFSFFVMIASSTQAMHSGQHFDIYKIKPQQGKLFYQLFSCQSVEQELWTDLVPLHHGSVVPTLSRITINLDKPLPKKTCIRVFQDTNNNQQLDFGTGNIPIEPVGFSNNPNLMLGYPLPLSSQITVHGDSPIMIKMNYRRKR